ncbi:MAG: hypothetical protein M1833_001279 [Piccolia ochrophora]|nr:MAG: hypothetical protein M1833_001279 [Piccolia ochrophora]
MQAQVGDWCVAADGLAKKGVVEDYTLILDVEEGREIMKQIDNEGEGEDMFGCERDRASRQDG